MAMHRKPRPQCGRAAHGRRLAHGKRLIDRGEDLRRGKLVKALAIAVEPALAAFELARQARQRILHQPDIAATLDRAGGLPWSIEAAERPWPPKSRIGWTVKRHGRDSRCCSKMGDRGVRADINARGGDQRRQFRPSELAIEPQNICIAPYLIEIGAVGSGAGAHGHKSAVAQRRSQRAPAFARPALVDKHRRRMDHRVKLARRQLGTWRSRRTDDFAM